MCGRVTPLAPAWAGEPPLNLDVRRQIAERHATKRPRPQRHAVPLLPVDRGAPTVPRIGPSAWSCRVQGKGSAGFASADRSRGPSRKLAIHKVRPERATVSRFGARLSSAPASHRSRGRAHSAAQRLTVHCAATTVPAQSSRQCCRLRRPSVVPTCCPSFKRKVRYAQSQGGGALPALELQITLLRWLSPNYALQRSWTHKLHGARTARKSRTRQLACAVTGRRAAAELRR